ncbi:Aste57867_10562 [Aphanomyces stellatus]|uniref:Aste57867_10562 protein n=1 Tax=Aphanomyces stellatus TaxID=120398 RepID=A0A485KR71_9STRA|nr:hypothetical protein As57867_010522 [Aphanomyces stellatus]VFT87435.1 Aste57867_10562 [Aphanomyces stellatus]
MESVDTLVYQMEDDDGGIKFDAIRKLREIASQLHVHQTLRNTTPATAAVFPVRNSRRFLNCVRRRLNDTDARVVVEALLLVCDLIPVIGADHLLHLYQIVLPQLLPMLPRDCDWDDDTAFPQTALHVFWVYAQHNKDLRPVMDVLINQGLNHDDGGVRESAILAVKHLLQQNSTHSSCALDYGMLVEVLIPSMEDDEEATVVAAEETLGYIQGRLGAKEFAKFTSKLNGRDRAILLQHRDFIAKFVPEEAASSPSSLSQQQLQFDLVPKWIVDTLLHTPTASLVTKQTASDHLTHVVRHSQLLTCQWTHLVAFLAALCPVSPADDPSHSIPRAAVACLLVVVQTVGRRIQECSACVIPALTELLADLPQDAALLELLQLVFTHDRHVCLKLAPSYQHHSARVREQACTVLLMVLLSHPDEFLPMTSLVLHVGRLLSDPSGRVRQLAMETCAVLKHTCHVDIVTALQANDDVYADGIDWTLLQRRLNQSFVPVLATNGALVLDTKAAQAVNEPPQPSNSVATIRKATSTSSTSDDKSHLWLPKETTVQPPTNQASAQDIAKNLTTLKQRSLQKSKSKQSSEPGTARKTSTPVESGSYSDMGEREHQLHRPNPTATVYHDDDRPIKPAHASNHGDKPPRFNDDMDTSIASAIKVHPGDRRQEQKHAPAVQDDGFPKPRHKTEGVLRQPVVYESAEDRPIRARPVEYDKVDDMTTTTPRLAPPKRVQKPKVVVVQDDESPRRIETPPHDPSPPEKAPRAISLATRKRLEAKQASKEIDDASAAAIVAEPSGWKSPDELRAALRAGKQEYLSTSDLEAFPLTGLPAKPMLAKCIQHISASDWEKNFEGLTDLRRVAVHAPDVVAAQLAVVVKEVTKQINNLRSSVAKNAMLTIDTLCVTLTRKMDVEMDEAMPLLLKRAADTNAFLSEAAVQTLDAAVQNCSAGKLFLVLLPHATNKTTLVRKQVAIMLGKILVVEAQANRLESCREYDRVLSVLCTLVGDSNNEVRDAAKPTLLYLKNHRHVDTARLKRVVPGAAMTRVEQVLQSSSAISTPPSSTPLTGEPKDRSAKAKSKPATSSNNSAFESIPQLQTALESSNWKDRFEALGQLKQLILDHGPALCQHGKLIVLFDSLHKRLEDGNAKVNVCALETLNQVIPVLGNGLDAVMSNLAPILTRNLAANNQKAAALADSALELMCSHVESKLMCPHFVVITRSANSRTKPILIQKLKKLTIQADTNQTSAISRYVLPLAFDLMKESKTDIRDATHDLLRALYGTLGSAMLDSVYKLPKTHQDKLSQILGVHIAT